MKFSERYRLAQAWEGKITGHDQSHKISILHALINEVIRMHQKHEPRLGEILQCARICHEVNRAYSQSIGDMSHAKWENAPAWQQDSAIAGVRAHVESKLTMTPEDSHLSWLKQKMADGWKYGKTKDADKKTHPCYVNYVALPAEQQAKDRLFRATVHAYFAEHFGS